MREWKTYAPADALLLALAWRSYIDDERYGFAGGHSFCRDLCADPLCRCQQLGRRRDAMESVLEIPDDLIEADSTESHRGFVLASGVGNDHDWFVPAQYRA